MAQSSLPALRICWVTHEGLGQLPCPSLWAILKRIAHSAFGYSAKLDAAMPEIREHARDFLAGCALNIGNYAFYRCYWQQAKLHGITSVTFVAADMPAFACVDEKLTAIYQQHGLMTLTILMPNFNQLYINSEDESRYWKRLLPFSEVFLVALRGNAVFTASPTLMILSPNIAINERLVAMESMVSWALDNALAVVIRPTLKVTVQELQIIQEKYPQAIIDDLRFSLSDSYQRWQPKIIASWASTGLATALDYGVIAVSFDNPFIEDGLWGRMIYAMKDHVLFWPKDKLLMDQALKSASAYQAQLLTLRINQDDILFQ